MARIPGPSLELPWRSFTPLTVSSVYPDGTRARCRVCEDLGANRLTVTKGVIMDFNINLYTSKGILSLPLKFYPHNKYCDVEEVRVHVKKHLSELFNVASDVSIETNEEM